MINREIQIQALNGLDASPVALLVQLANKFRSSIYLEAGSRKVNAKSIMGMMSVGMNYEDKVRIIADGEDEEEAVAAIEDFLTHK